MLEIRSFGLVDADIKSGKTFRGRALVYDQPSPLPTAIGQMIFESINRGAFPETNAPLFREHKPELLLARNSVRITHNSGMDVEAELLSTPAAEEARELVQAGELRGMSIGFMPLGKGFVWERRGSEIHRSLPQGRLCEVSLVAMPAYDNTSASVRSLTVPDHLVSAEARDNDRWLRYLDAVTRA